MRVLSKVNTVHACPANGGGGFELLLVVALQQKLDYIHDNPVRAGFVEKEEDWLYSSAGDFYAKKGMLELSFIV